MQAYLAGDPTLPLQRAARILREHGWRVDFGPVPGHCDVAILSTPSNETAVRAAITQLRRRAAPKLLLLLGGPWSDRNSALTFGADDLIAGDLAAEIMMNRLMAMLRLRSTLFQPVHQIGDLTIDLTRRCVRRGGHKLLLSQREFQLLTLLAQEAGAVVPRCAIIQRLWRDDFAVSDNAVDALASRLRRRIDGPFAVKLVQTVRGIGYCLSAPEEIRLAG